MPRIQLIVYVNPGEANVFVNIKRKDGIDETVTAIVDTGAEAALFPIALLEWLDHEITERGTVTVDQAGIARHSFQATQARINIFLLDTAGNRTEEFQILAWFAETDYSIVGFGGILERAIFHLDMPNLNGYLEFANG